MYTGQDLINAYKAGLLESAFRFAVWHSGEMICGTQTKYNDFKKALATEDISENYVKSQADFMEMKEKE
jgi:hypothetical protein